MNWEHLMIQVLEHLCLFFLTIMGVLVHFLKKKVSGQTLADIRTYFLTHFRDTAVVLFTAIVAFATAAGSDTLNWMTAGMIGYTADSFFNKNTADQPKTKAGS